MKEEHELEHARGDSVTVLPLAKESEEELTLLVLPSRISEDKHELRSVRCVTSGESMFVVPWKSLFGWLSVSISPFLLIGPSTLGLIQLIGLWLLLFENLLVGLGIGLGGNPLLLTNICRDGEKHCFPIPLVGEGAGETGMKSILFGDEDFSDLSKSLSLRLKLSSHDWLICIAVCTSLSWAVSLFIKSTPSSLLI